MSKGKIPTEENIVFENDKRFSESLLWESQREYYHSKGIEAWTGEVPFYITSNAFIANCYADMIICFIKDWVNLHPESCNKIFNLVELGTGSGQFSFYTIKSILKKLASHQLNQIKICYVMTDFTQNNLDFWNKHPALKPYFDTRVLDSALLDFGHDDSLHLTHRNIRLEKNDTNNPIIVIANYLFDSLPNDIFYINKQTVKESLISLSTSSANLNTSNPKDWEKVTISHNDVAINSPHYSIPEINKSLFQYQNKLNDTHLLFPIKSLIGLDKLKKISGNKMLLITSDKGYNKLEEIDNLDFPGLDFHGSISVMTNYHAMGEYFKACQGDYFLQTPRDGLTTGVFSSDITLSDLPQLNTYLINELERFGPVDFFNYYEHIESNFENFDIRYLTSFLSQSCWDSSLFNLLAAHLTQLMVDKEDPANDFLLQNIDAITENFYYLPESDDVFFNLGLMLYNKDIFDKAINCFQKSLDLFGGNYETFFNLGLCHYYNQDNLLAINFFKKSLNYNNNTNEINEMISNAQDKLNIH